MLSLFIIDGPDKGKGVEIDREVLVVGRSPKSDFQVYDRSVSARHMRILMEDGDLYVEDLNSTNGTYVNGVKLEPGRREKLNQGDTIAIGSTLFSVEREYSLEGTLVSEDTQMEITGQFGEEYILKGRPMTKIKNFEVIYRLSTALMESFDIYEILETIMNSLFDCLKRIDRGAILLLDDAKEEIKEIISRTRNPSDTTPLRYSKSIVERVIREAKPVSMVDTQLARQIDLSDSIRSMKIRSVMCVPLISRKQVRGAIYVDSLEKPHSFRKEDLHLLLAIASPAAIAIENALIYSNLERMVESRTYSLREAQRKLRSSEERFRAIFDNMRSGVVVFQVNEKGDDFIVVDVNRAAQEIEGFRKEDVIGKRMEEVFPGFLELRMPEAFREVWESGRFMNIPRCFYRDEVRSGWREYDIYRLPSGELVLLYDDITQRVKAEQEQKELQRRVLQAQKLESIGRLAGGIAHNFRNILQAILGNVEYLEMVEGHNNNVAETLENVTSSVEKGVELIQSLLHFSKLGEEFALSPIDLADVIEDTFKIVERLFDKSIQIEMDLETGLTINGNHSLLSQVFMNLLTNARDAMPEGGVIRIRAWREGGRVIASVSDTGHGMEKETLEKIFDPFFTNKDVGKGTGLGLTTVHGIVEEHNGSISVESKPGEGTTFTISFPLENSQEEPTEVKSSTLYLGKGERVMIVDDESTALNALASMIKRLGYQVKAVTRPKKAIEEYKTWSPDLLLLDRNMPEMDGVSCMKEILARDPDAKIVIVSGYEETGPQGLEDDIRELIKGYMTKPCNLEQLSRTLAQVLGKIPDNG